MKQNYSFIKLFMLTVMALFAGNAMAQTEVKFDFATPDGLKAMGVPEDKIPTVAASADAGVGYETTGPFTMDGVTITSKDAGEGVNTNRVWSAKGNDGTKYDYRVYGNTSKELYGTLTITAPSGQDITGITFTAGNTWNEPTANVGTYSSKAWSGNANSVTLTMSKGQCQFKQITVTIGGTPQEIVSIANTPETAYTVARALEIIEAGQGLDTKVYVKGKVSQIDEEGVGYGNITFWMSDDGTTTNQLEAYHCKYLENKTYDKEGTVKVGDEVIVYGKLTDFKGTKEFTSGCYIYSHNGKTQADVTPVETTKAENIAATYTLANKTPVILTLKDAKVLYTWTSNNGNTQTFVRDASGAIQFYNTGLDLKEGDVLNGTVNLTYSPYNGLPELTKNDDTDAGDFAVTAGEKATPIEVTEATAADHLNDLVTMKDFTPYLDSEKNRYYTSDSKAVQLYNSFHIDGIDLTTLDTSKKYTVTGIMVKGQINVITISESSDTSVNGIEAAKSQNAPAYNVAGQRVKDGFRGIQIQNGRKVLK